MREVKKDYLIFGAILIFSFVLRVLFLDKPGGFWHNEMVMYNQASAAFPLGIIKAAVSSDVHFPLYQLILNLWMKLFGNGDITIRLFSVVVGVFAVLFAFLAGKELKDEKLGNIFALLVAINSTLIFYSQEVKFYGMLATLSSMVIYFTLKIIKGDKLKDYLGYILSTSAIIYTFTIGILYVAAHSIAFLTFILIKKRELLRKFLIANFSILVTIIPFAIYLILNFGKYEGASWIFTNNIYTTFVLLQNYFSPVIVGIYNNPLVYIPRLAFNSFIFIYIPCGLALWGIIRAVKNDKNNYYLLAVPMLFLLFEVILCANSGLRMLTRYTILAVVPLLFLVAIGFRSLSCKLRTVVLSYIFIVNTLFLIGSPMSALRGYRDFGQKPTANILIKNNISSDDVVVNALRKTDFNKYLDFKGKKFSMLNDFVYQPYAYDSSKPNKYEAFRNYIFDKRQINKEYEKYFLKTVINRMKKGSRLFLLWDENYQTYPFEDEKNYKNYPIMTLSLSKTNADTIRLCIKYLKPQNAYQSNHFKVLIFKK